MSDSFEHIKKMMEEGEAQYLDLRFSDPQGKWHHTAQHISTVDEAMFEDGVMFDGSSIEGWKAINESDMILKPDASTAVLDPFSAEPQLIVFCDVEDPGTGTAYTRDPRSTVRKAQLYLESTGIGDTAYFGPEAEFFVFDHVRWSNQTNLMAYHIDDEEQPINNWSEYENGNQGHRPRIKGGYFPVAPVDSGTDIRAEMVSTCVQMGIEMEKHHHEVAPSQHELGMRFNTLLRTADNMQLYKYVVKMVAHNYGKTATFMPKPIVGDNGSGMHVHMSIWKDNRNMFAGEKYADLSQTCLYYIGGIIKHAKALNAFTNPATNSYKRLVPGYEAPVLLAYSARNRSAACRIPYVTDPNGKRVEVRFPDATANPYLAYSALLMAGLDGISNRIDPGEAMDKNLYDLPPEEVSNLAHVSASLEEALNNLENDYGFLLNGNVFTEDQIKAYIEQKREDVERLNMTPHPVEFDMYYSS
ncbi:MAG: type I glutamate--ammonia ligase [Pseudomonadota bacterium]